MFKKLKIITELFFLINYCIGINLNSEDVSGCGIWKGCFFVPPGCEATRNSSGTSNCTGAFLFTVDDVGIKFTLIGTELDLAGAGISPHFVAVGFSLDHHMGDDTVLTCVTNGTSGYIFSAWNDKTRGYVDREATRRYIDPGSVGLVDSDMRCSGRWRFQPRPKISNSAEYIYNLSFPNSNFFLLFARGYANFYSGEILGHAVVDGSGFPWISENNITFCYSNTCNINNTDQILFLNKAHQSPIPRILKHFFAVGHAVLCMGAFWVLGGPGILTARYLRCQKSSFWFNFHGFCMIIVFILISIAFFGNFYQAEWRIFTCTKLCNYEEYVKFVHTIIGIFTYSCLCLQVILGIFRPKKDSVFRPYVNWFHTGLGFITWTAGSTACVLGCHLGKTGLYENFGHYPQHAMTVVIATFVGVAFLCEVSSRRHNYVPEGGKQPENLTGGCNGFSVFLVIVYFVVAVLMVALLTLFLFTTMYTRGFRW